ncbi:hypothetical protein L210DRAFT_989070 [Boletus edulis BED1]|uniref:Uncharacterized protein n=1 Tax=Boletus edulis BED1 TaxID=1328754 RepID=A0AAD4BNM5_BOLED|nr:hypothetical protein L210DRAFT_989070 [Boletus edulis BED1]
MLIETLITFTVHLFYGFDWDRLAWINWANCAIVNLSLGLYAVFRGDGTFTSARRSDTSIPGCAVLLDQDLTGFLSGNQNIVEPIAESGSPEFRVGLVRPISSSKPYAKQLGLSYLRRATCYSARQLL